MHLSATPESSPGRLLALPTPEPTPVSAPEPTSEPASESTTKPARKTVTRRRTSPPKDTAA